MAVTTTDGLKGDKLLLCHVCRQRVALVMTGPDRRDRCYDCLPPKEKAVLDPPEGSLVEEWTSEEE